MKQNEENAEEEIKEPASKRQKIDDDGAAKEMPVPKEDDAEKTL